MSNILYLRFGAEIELQEPIQIRIANGYGHEFFICYCEDGESTNEWLSSSTHFYINNSIETQDKTEQIASITCANVKCGKRYSFQVSDMEKVE